MSLSRAEAKRRAKLIRSLRAELGLSQRPFARLLGVENPSVSRWETGAVDLTGPAYRLVCLLAQLEGVQEALERLE